MNYKKLLSEDYLKQSVETFRTFRGFEKCKNVEKQASVLVPLCHVNNDICILYTRRKIGLRRHSGQVSFPGGMVDRGEMTEDAATRETEEEVGILKKNIKVYGCGPSFIRREVLITPVVGYVGKINLSKLSLNKNEVEYAFALPLSKFCDLNNCHFTKFRDSYTMPVFLIDGYNVWGITAYITHIFLKCLLNDEYKFNFP